MGLFGIKKANEEPKNNNTFINTDVINAADYSNMPNNTVVGYNQPTMEVVNTDVNNMNNETFVYAQVDSNQFNNQFVNVDTNQGQTYYDQNAYVQDMNVSQDMSYNPETNYTQDNSFNTDVTYNQNVNLNQNNNFSEFGSTDTVVPTNDVVVTVDNNFNVLPDASTQPEFSAVEQVPFDDSALFALPAGAVVEEPQVVLDPLDNANNPVPVNPVAPKEEKKDVVEEKVEEEIPLFEEEEEVKTNLFTVINMMVGVIIKPGTTISTNARRYKKIFDAFAITFWVTMLSFVMSLGGRIIAGCFSRTENAISGASKILLDFTGLLDTNNYIPYLLLTLIISLVAILVVALVYYISSFICSKGIHIGTYFAISTLSLVPVIIGFTVLHPIINILSSDIALMVLIFTVIYALIILFTGINQVLKFKSNDGRIIYNAVNMAIIFSVMLFIFNTLSRLNILDLMILF